MYTKLFAPVMTRIHRCSITEVKSKGQKEVRICDVLEPVLGSHRLIVSDSVIEQDYQTACDADGNLDSKYSGFYQLTRISHERGSLQHDDRLDALAIGVAFFTDSMEKDSAQGEADMVEDFIESHLEDAMMGHENLREIVVAGVHMQWEDDEGADGNFMGGW